MPATATVVDLRDVARQPEEQTPVTAGSAIEGQIDAVQDGRIYGWAWDRSHPADRLHVEVRLEREGGEALSLGATVADRPRADLAGSGIGDGSHAFEADIVLPPDADLRRVVAVIRSPTTGGTETFVRPDAEGQRLDRLIAPHLQRLETRIDALRRDQRQVASAQQAVGRMLRDLAEQISAQRTDAKADLADSLREVTERVGGLEVFLVRMDSTLRGFDATLSGRGAGPAWPPVATVLAAGVGAFLATLAGLALFH